MNNQPLDRLLARRVKLHARKYHLINEIYYPSKNYLRVYDYVSELKILLVRQMRLNQRIVRRIRRLGKRSKKDYRSFLDSLNNCMADLHSFLTEEYIVLREIGPLNIMFYNMEVFFFKKSYRTFFSKQRKRFMSIFDKELEVNRMFVDMVSHQNFILSGMLDEIEREKKEFAKARRLVTDAQESYSRLLKSIGDETKVRREGDRLLGLVKKIQGTQVYEFIKDDVVYFVGKVRYIMKHPREHKLTYVLASVYIVAPGTFELTFAVLFVRYVTKYAAKKIKR